ncbi:MAG: IclR family transcriptional regulator [Betaproteobacteria bacterium]|nr:IclR family transcriptional regulator [Betaproteobacteria bacterium]
MTEKKSHENVRAVARALDILLAFRPQDTGLTVAELLKRVDLSRPTLYRLLSTLEQSGFIASSGEPQQFRLGSAVAHLAHVWMNSQSIAQLAQPVLQKLWQASGETVSLFVPEGMYRVCVAEIESAQPLSFCRGVGYRERLALGASGRAILTHMASPPDFSGTQEATTKPDPAELAAIRRRGYAVSRNELIEGAVALAAPFFNGADQIAGSLCLFGPDVRMTEGRVAELSGLLMAEAAELSRSLGRRTL